MKIPLYQVDAFTSTLFTGNPAAVCLLDDWLEDRVLQAMAAENNLSETAFLVPNQKGFDLRWFTPVTEVALCGHATLASAYVLFNARHWTAETVRFQTRMSGELSVSNRGDLLEMDFPARPPSPRTAPPGLLEALAVIPEEVYGSAEDLMVVLENEEAVKKVRPDFSALKQVDCRGTIITARGDRSDFVSRFFAPRVGVLEDPVTGSAHCVLTPYWAGILGKTELHALQVSLRGGELFCTLAGDRIKISGRAVLYLEGEITI
jgi:PhzF family phenazine biosynthesis protein